MIAVEKAFAFGIVCVGVRECTDKSSSLEQDTVQPHNDTDHDEHFAEPFQRFLCDLLIPLHDQEHYDLNKHKSDRNKGAGGHSIGKHGDTLG